jgi:hypothetical protein
MLVRFGVAAACVVAWTSLPAEEGGALDAVFSEVPFEQWLSQGEQAHIRWTARVSAPELSNHQRLVSRLDVEIDGAELARRRDKGKILMFVQLKDGKGQLWQNHDEIDLKLVHPGIKSSNVVYSQLFFVLPGDYGLAVAVFATATGEHSVVKRKLHVSEMKNDVLPEAWRDLPAIEFIASASPPDNWYLPSIKGRLRLAVETHHPAHVDLVVNLTPSERASGSMRIQNRNLAALIPAARVMSEVEWRNLSFNLSLLDLSRRRVVFEQDIVSPENTAQALDWSKARGSLAELNPGIIDIKSLENRKFSADFFLSEISRRIDQKDASTSRALIVLSSAVTFEPGQEMHPIEAGRRADCRVFYIRYLPLPPVMFRPGGRSRGAGPIGGFPAHAAFAPQFDELAPLLKPLDPRVFDVATPEQFRKAVAAILAEIEKM